MFEDRQAGRSGHRGDLGLVPEFFQRVPDYLLPTEWASFKSLAALGPDGDPEQVQGDDRSRGFGRHALPLLLLLPHRGGAAVRRHRGRDRRDGADRQEHDGLEHVPEHAPVRLRRSSWTSSTRSRPHPRADGRRRARLTRLARLAPVRGRRSAAARRFCSQALPRPVEIRQHALEGLERLRRGRLGRGTHRLERHPRAATSADSSWLVAVTVKTFSRERSIRIRSPDHSRRRTRNRPASRCADDAGFRRGPGNRSH